MVTTRCAIAANRVLGGMLFGVTIFGVTIFGVTIFGVTIFGVTMFGVILQGFAPAYASETDPVDIFNNRIMPIFESKDPSSCVQCHLSSVDLKNYILPSSDATFASLRDQGLIDLESPEKSKILTLIRMGEKDLDEGARLIHDKMRRVELDAFATWITTCVDDPRVRNLPSAKKVAAPKVPDEVIRHARKSRVVDSFVRNVWSQRMRCFPCHTPHEIDPSNPRHKIAIKKQKEFAEQFGESMVKRLALFRETPEATLSYLVESSAATPSDRLPLLDLNEPTKSLLLQKPLSKLPKKKEDGTFEDPSYRFPVSHMGGLKMHPNDQSYKSIVSWIQDYARVVQGRYETIDDLPADNWFPSQLVVRIKFVPESWKSGDVVQLFVHEWNNKTNTWNDEPIAFTQGTVTPRRMVNGALFLLGSDAARAAEWKTEATLPAGRYLVKAYHDSDKKVAADATTILTQADYFGAAEVPKARWRKGFRFAEVVPGKKLVKTN